jgi:hypothetical protein
LITFTSKGSFRKTEAFLDRMKKGDVFRVLDRYGRQGVTALSSATPRRSGATANAWYHEVVHGSGRHAIIFHNSNVHNGAVIAILIQYGHGTGTGGYVVGRDYINPVIRPLFDKIADDVWKAVKG